MSLLPLPLAVGSTRSKLGRDPSFRRLLGTTILHNPAEFLFIQAYNCTGLVTSVACPLPRIVLGFAHSTAAHAAVSFASRFVFDVCRPCFLTLFHARQRVHKHLVDGKRRCLQALAASVEPASESLVQRLLDQDKRVSKGFKKHLSVEWQPKHLPAIRTHGPVQSWAHR